MASQWLFYGGIAAMAAAALGAAAAAVLFCVSGRQLRETLDKEYGKKKR